MRLTLWAVGVGVLLGACSAPTTSSPWPVQLSPDHPLWVCGNSIAIELALAMPSEPNPCGSPGAGFTDHATTGKILDWVLSQLDDDRARQPDLMLLAGGASGAVDATVQEQIDGMVELEAAVLARGIPVRWVASPVGPDRAELVNPLSDWLLANRADTIDCREHAVDFRDGVHLTAQSNARFASCVNAALPAELQSPPD
jgi:hypothetical protein